MSDDNSLHGPLNEVTTPKLGPIITQSNELSSPLEELFVDDYFEHHSKLSKDMIDETASLSSTSTIHKLRSSAKARATTQLTLNVSGRMPSSPIGSQRSASSAFYGKSFENNVKSEIDIFLTKLLGHPVNFQRSLTAPSICNTIKQIESQGSSTIVDDGESHSVFDDANVTEDLLESSGIGFHGRDDQSIISGSSRDSLDFGSSFASSYRDDVEAMTPSMINLKTESTLSKTSKKLDGHYKPLKWTRHNKHFFILSNAGKPIYSRHGDEFRLSSHMGVIQAIISFFVDFDDIIKVIHAGEHKFVFLIKGPLYFVAVSKTGESEVYIRQQLDYMYSQVVSVLTLTQLQKIFETRTNFDLRRLLGGTEIFLDSLADTFSRDPGILLGSVHCLRMKKSLRDKVGQYMYASRRPELLYGILTAGNQLVNLLRPKRHSLHPTDLHLIFNMMACSSSFRSGESWMPICLPKFNNKGFLHAYVSYLAPEVCLILISSNKDKFFEMSEARNALVETLTASKSLEGIDAALQKQRYHASETGIAGLRHFLYKSRQNVQYTMPDFAVPYTKRVDQDRLLQLYQHAHERMHQKQRPLRIYTQTGDYEAILGWIAPSFELYAVFSPLVPKRQLISSANTLVRWLKREEDKFFITNSPTF